MPRKPKPKARRKKGTGSIKERRPDFFEGQITIDGATTYFSGTSYADVDARILRFLADQRRGLDHASGREPLGDYLNRWLRDVAPDLAPDSVRNYRLYIDRYLAPVAHIPIGALTVAHVEDALTALLRSGIARTTVANVKALLSRALRVAERRDIIPKNPAERAEMPGRPDRPAEIAPLTPAQARALLKRMHGDRLEALFVAVLACGIRQGEALGLRWQDVDLDAGVIRVRVQLKRIKDKDGGAWALAPLKTAASRRTIHLPPTAVVALRLHRARQDAERTGKRPPPRRWGFCVREHDAGLGWKWGLVFTEPRGEPIHGAQIARVFKRYLAEAGLPVQRFHDTRHFAASLLVAQGVAERVVMDILGHRRSEMTRHYSHVFDASRQEAAARIEAALTVDNRANSVDTGVDSGDDGADA